MFVRSKMCGLLLGPRKGAPNKGVLVLQGGLMEKFHCNWGIALILPSFARA